MRKYISLIIISVCFSCKSIKSDNAVLEFKKVSYTEASETWESDEIEFDIYLHKKKRFNLPIHFSELSQACYTFGGQHKEFFNNPIITLEAIRPPFPVFIIENKEGELKYFLNRRKFEEPVLYNGRYIYAPGLKLEGCKGLIILKSKTNYKNEVTYLRDLNIYTFDLKIKETDTLVRLHYLYKDYIVSSNWINVAK